MGYCEMNLIGMPLLQLKLEMENVNEHCFFVFEGFILCKNQIATVLTILNDKMTTSVEKIH